MGGIWEVVRQYAQATSGVAGNAVTAAAAFLEGENPVARLMKDTLTAIFITAFSSLVIGGLLALRENRRRAKIKMPIRTFVLEAITSAHNGIREAIANFNAFDRKQLKTRLRRLGDQLSKVRAALSPTVVAGFGFFEEDQQTAIAEYIGAIRWDNVITVDQSVSCLREINRKYCAVMDLCDTNKVNAWDDHDFMAMTADLQRLEPVQKPKPPEPPAPVAADTPNEQAVAEEPEPDRQPLFN